MLRAERRGSRDLVALRINSAQRRRRAARVGRSATAVSSRGSPGEGGSAAAALLALAATGVRVGAAVAHQMASCIRDLDQDPGHELDRVDRLRSNHLTVGGRLV